MRKYYKVYYLLSGFREALLVEGVHQHYLIVYQRGADWRAEGRNIDFQEWMKKGRTILSQGPYIQVQGLVKGWSMGSQHISLGWDQ